MATPTTQHHQDCSFAALAMLRALDRDDREALDVLQRTVEASDLHHGLHVLHNLLATQILGDMDQFREQATERKFAAFLADVNALLDPSMAPDEHTNLPDHLAHVASLIQLSTTMHLAVAEDVYDQVAEAIPAVVAHIFADNTPST